MSANNGNNRRKPRKNKKTRNQSGPPAQANQMGGNIPRIMLPRSATGSLTFTTTAAHTTLAPALVIVTNTLHSPWQTGVVSTPNKNQFFRQFLAYKVMSYRVRIEYQNTGPDPVYAYFLQSNTDPTTTITNYAAQSANPYCSVHLMGPVTAGASSRYSYRSRKTISQLNGSWIATQADDKWSGSGQGLGVSTADPTDKTYLGVGFVSSVGAGPITVSGLVHLELEAIFWDRFMTIV